MAEPVSLVRRGGEFPECTPRHGSLGRSAAVSLPYWIQALLTTQLRTLLDGNREWLGSPVKANGQDWSPLTSRQMNTMNGLEGLPQETASHPGPPSGEPL